MSDVDRDPIERREPAGDALPEATERFEFADGRAGVAARAPGGPPAGVEAAANDPEVERFPTAAPETGPSGDRGGDTAPTTDRTDWSPSRPD